MERINNAIYCIIKKELKKSGISYKDLACYLEVSEVSVKRLLNGLQPLSMARMLDISELVQTPLSTIIADAEKSIAAVIHFNEEQNLAFLKQPELFTLFDTIINEQKNAKQLMSHFGLNRSSMYLYLRELENLGLITIMSELNFRLTVPKNIAFSDSATFPVHFRNHIIDGLKERVQQINPHKKDAYFISAELQLTEEEFHSYNLKLEALMMETLNISQTRDANSTDTNEYTIADMGAIGNFLPQFKKPTNLI